MVEPARVRAILGESWLVLLSSEGDSTTIQPMRAAKERFSNEISRKSCPVLVRSLAARYSISYWTRVSRLEPGPSIIHTLLSNLWAGALRSFADTVVARRTVEAFLRARSRRLLSRLEHTDPVRAQLQTLL